MHDSLLTEILSQPSAPYREMHVRKTIIRTLERGGVPHFLDPVGNIVVGAASKKDYDRLISAKTREPLRFFIAHMDHPGFHGLKWKAGRLEFKWHGGSPIKHLNGSKVWLCDPKGNLAYGKVAQAKLLKSGRAIDSGTLTVDKKTAQLFSKTPPKNLFGGFAFREFVWEKNKVLYTKAADDLVGSFAIVTVALELFKKRSSGPKPPFLAILTRAEEVGFVGCLGHFELGWLQKAKRPVVCVSLETSRTLPGAIIGKGPVVRLGDKFSVFDKTPLRVLMEIARKKLPDAHQYRVMDGGTCEGSAATVYGFTTVGISVPLGNYHNQSFEGGPDSRGSDGPAPEFVHRDDIEGLITLCRGFMEKGLDWEEPFAKVRKVWAHNLVEARELLKMPT